MNQSINPNKAKINAIIAKKKRRKENTSADSLSKKIIAGDKQSLSEAITLLESSKLTDQANAQEIINMCIPHSGKSFRIGITGVPGVGKSTFIENFGQYLIKQGKTIAVLAIDPSSEKTGGSILGDKTRMEKLSVSQSAYIRPTATAGSLGGVARKTNESIILCEAAGFDYILIETVGVGQSEITVNAMTDFFLLLMLAGAGDELQGIKRGIMEMADTILITKADGENIKHSNLARLDYKNALHLFPQNENNWVPKVETVSSLNKFGLEKVFKILNEFYDLTKSNGHFELNRNIQQKYWMYESFKDLILNNAYEKADFESLSNKLEEDLLEGKISSFNAAEILFNKTKNND